MSRIFFTLVVSLALTVLSCSDTAVLYESQQSTLSERALEWVGVKEEPPLFPWEKPGRLPDRIVLTWSDDPSSTFSVTWRTDTTVTQPLAQIALATPAPGLDEFSDTLFATSETLDLSFVKDEFVKAQFHSVTFTNLLPDTLYAYRVGDGEMWSSWYQTRTASPTHKPFKFIYFGDAQNGLYSHWARNIRMAYTVASDARFIVHAGDLVNIAHRNTEWGEWFEAAGWIAGTLPSIPIPGNHEYQPYNLSFGDRKLSALWRPQFTLPMNGAPGLEETTYFIDYQGVRIIGLDSNRLQAEQVDWLEATLQSNPHPWTLLTFHHPIYSSAGNRDNPEIRALWKPLFDEYGVDLVMQGHDHTYARGRAFNAGSGSNRRDPSGTVYVNSVSGSKMYSATGERWRDKGAILERAAEETQLFQVIEIAGDTLRYQAYTATGHLYDAFDLVKQMEAPNLFVERSGDLGPERLHPESPARR